MFVAKIDTNGVWEWAAKGGGIDGYDFGYGVAVDASGYTYITGFYIQTACFGTTILDSNGGSDIFVAKLDTSGKWLGAVRGGGIGGDEGRSIIVDAMGNSFITGFFSGTANFGETTLTSTGYTDVFVAKVSSGGNEHLTCECVTPREGLIYYLGNPVFPIPLTIVIGGIWIQVNANDTDTGIDHVDTIINGVTHTAKHWSPPWEKYVYSYHFNQTTIILPIQCTLKTIAYDRAGNSLTCCDFSFRYWNPPGLPQ